MPGLRPPEVAAATDTPAAATGPGAPDRSARIRVALFVLVLLLAGGGAWGAGRLLSLNMDPAAVQMDHQQHHVGHVPGMDMPG